MDPIVPLSADFRPRETRVGGRPLVGVPVADPPPRSPYGIWEQGGPWSGRFAGIDEEPHTGIATAVGMTTRPWAPRLSQVGKTRISCDQIALNLFGP